MYQNSIDQDITEFAVKVNNKKNIDIKPTPASNYTSNKQSFNNQSLIIDNTSITNTKEILQDKQKDNYNLNSPTKIDNDNKHQIIIEFD